MLEWNFRVRRRHRLEKQALAHSGWMLLKLPFVHLGFHSCFLILSRTMMNYCNLKIVCVDDSATLRDVCFIASKALKANGSVVTWGDGDYGGDAGDVPWINMTNSPRFMWTASTLRQCHYCSREWSSSLRHMELSRRPPEMKWIEECAGENREWSAINQCFFLWFAMATGLRWKRMDLS